MSNDNAKSQATSEGFLEVKAKDTRNRDLNLWKMENYKDSFKQLHVRYILFLHADSNE